MYLQTPGSTGPTGPALPHQIISKLSKFQEHSSTLPFGQYVSLPAIAGPTYLTAQTLIQQVAFSLSDKLFTYSPDTFDLDLAVKRWSLDRAQNAHGYTPVVSAMQIRQGAGTIALGYMFSKDFDLKKRHVPQTLLASSSTLQYLRAALDQLSLLYAVASPLVAHIAAVDLSQHGLVADYVSPMATAEELGLGLLSSASAYESQHMALLATLMADILPTLHIYDGVTVGRETVRVIDVVDSRGLSHAHQTIRRETASVSKRRDNDVRVTRLLEAFNDELGTVYDLFEYHGHSTPDHVLVVFGTVESSLGSQVASRLAKGGKKVGIVVVRVYRPFVEEAFIRILPASAKKVVVLGQVKDQQAVNDDAVHSVLYDDILATISFSEKWSTAPQVVDLKYPREESWTSTTFAQLFHNLDSKREAVPLVTATESLLAENNGPSLRLLDPSLVRQYIFWNVDDSPSARAPSVLAQLLSMNSSRNVTSKIVYDNTLQGGVRRTDIRDSTKMVEASYAIENADLVYVGEEKMLGKVDVLSSLKQGGALLVQIPGVKDEELEKRLPVGLRRAAAAKKIHLHVIDPSASNSTKDNAEMQSYLTQLAFLSIARPDLLTMGLDKLSAINGSLDLFNGLFGHLRTAVRRIEIPKGWTNVDADVEIPTLSDNITGNSFKSFQKDQSEAPSLLRSWEAAAKALTFKEAYSTKASLRPDLTTKTWTVHVKENRRLTPATYDRNIFHIEFDLGDSGLKYDIGESLGIHSENDEMQVKDFIKFYGLEPEEIVEVPSREDPDVLEVRTVYQSLMQNIDIFGRPPKKFYEALAEFASDEKEKKELLALAGPEGATEFKRRAEVDTITYADILLDFSSAHPGFHDMVRIINPLKRREYSVASSQQVTPNSVALMVVVVGWVDPKGRDRFGQATRYLWRLKVGEPVTVSVKPSVMKLPPQPSQPLIMAGLGTGLAPFRAFVQYRAWQKAQGIEIGSVLLYMGSRHQREEYLYGEEWEAYKDAGVITLLGRAFSRDQPQKIYIQDRMRQTLDGIVDAYLHRTGAFYLCGPTWPVPDVTVVLQEAIARDATAAGRKIDSRKEIERLKDDLRYVLEGMCPLVLVVVASG